MLKKSAQQIASFTSTLAEHLQSKTHLFVVFRQFFFFVFARTRARSLSLSHAYIYICVCVLLTKQYAYSLILIRVHPCFLC